MNVIASKLHPEISTETLRLMIEFNDQMFQETMVKRNFGYAGGPWEFNLRDILRWIDLMKSSGGISGNQLHKPEAYLDLIYGLRMRNENDRNCVRDLFCKVFNISKESFEASPPIFRITPNYVQIGSSVIYRSKNDNSNNTPRGLHILESQLPAIEAIAKCIEMGWMTLITGPSSSGKTSIVRVIASLAGKELDEFSLNAGVDAVEILGGFEQMDLRRQYESIRCIMRSCISQILKIAFLDQSMSSQISTIVNELHESEHLLQSQTININGLKQSISLANLIFESFSKDQVEIYKLTNTPIPLEIENLFQNLKIGKDNEFQGRFEWIDGLLLRAVQEGRWLLMDNVNFCPSSVLDRLNSLFEPNGSLSINERGSVNGKVQTIKPHPGFRLFMVMNPKFGEISRAMRNRAIEISLLNPEWANIQFNVQPSFGLSDTRLMLNSMGVSGTIFPNLIHFLHSHIQKVLSDHASTIKAGTTPRDMLNFSSLILERVQRGIPLSESIILSAFDIYIAPKSLGFEKNLQVCELVFGSNDNDNSFSSFIRRIEQDETDIIIPGLWPLFLSASSRLNESKLGTVFLDGAHISSLYYKKNDIYTTFSAPKLTEDQLTLLKPLPSKLNVFISALKIFVNRSTPSDFMNRYYWLNNLIYSRTSKFSFDLKLYVEIFQNLLIELSESNKHQDSLCHPARIIRMFMEDANIDKRFCEHQVLSYQFFI